MYYDYLMVVTHLGSSAASLHDVLSNHIQIRCPHRPLSYHDYRQVDYLRNNYGNYNRICADFILYNYSLTCKSLYQQCKFLYFLGDPSTTIHDLMHGYGYKPKDAMSHYAFRLQRMAQMAKETPCAFFVTLEDMRNKDQVQQLSDFLKLSKSLKTIPDKHIDQESVPFVAAAERAYKKYVGRLKKTGNASLKTS